ncbi:MAG TPA: hypothetical protein P5528_12035 [Steroidobacteraceae bacterium]|nr:hypothetical protein [Steroidobacteraceae bacterium]HRX90163.1 hypothetical protein [Steroidobacteraceae bacterium]
MSVIELPRPLQHYFAFAELERRGDSRRFSITLPYRDGERLEHIQWWWRVGDKEHELIGDAGVTERRTKEIARFCRHIERWLENNRQSLIGDEPIPVLRRNTATPAAPLAAADTRSDEPESSSANWQPPKLAAG